MYTKNMKGIIYIMTTAVSGLIKIGKTGTNNYQERMRNLETNGYYNVSSLKRFFAIKLDDYNDKENLLKEIFNKHRVGDSELFDLDYDLVRQLLLSFDGKVIYPKDVNREKEFDKISKTRKQEARFSFYKKGLSNGNKIMFAQDKGIIAKVCGEREVEYNGQVWKLAPLTNKIFEQKGRSTGSYRGANYFEYKGKRLKDLPNIN